MNYDLVFFAIFILIIFIFYQKHKSKFEVQGKIFALYRTKVGLNLMEKISRAPSKLLHFLGTLGIIVGFAGMIFIFYILIDGTIKLLTIPEAPPVLAPVLPGVTIPGLPKLSFFHWIIAIFIVAVIHEFSHGIFTKFHKIRIKSSGFAFLGPILAAFVEPDEEQLKKQNKYKQLSIFAAGPFSNILTGLVFLLIGSFIISPLAFSMLEYQGVQIASLRDNLPASLAGLTVGEKITSINEVEIKTISDFTKELDKYKPDDIINLQTDKKYYEISLSENPENPEEGYLGVSVTSSEAVLKKGVKEKYGNKLPWVLFWIQRLFFWLWAISLGIALFNLLPLGPVDGGRMFLTGLAVLIKDEKKVHAIWKSISFLVLALIIINLFPFLKKLFFFIFDPLISLIL